MTFPLMPAPVQAFVGTPTAEYVTLSSSNQGGTFTIPAPTSSERFIVYVTSNQNGAVSLTSCDINGVAASVASSGNSSFACAKAPTGTSITISTTYASGGGTSSSHVGFVYVVYGLQSPVWRSVGDGVGNPATVPVGALQNFLIFAPVQISNDNQTASFAAGMVLDVNGNNGNSFGLAAAHHDAFTSTQSYSVTCSVGIGTCYMGVGALR